MRDVYIACEVARMALEAHRGLKGWKGRFSFSIPCQTDHLDPKMKRFLKV
jgi:hypothetical protein